MVIFPNCKINLGLNIIGKRSDGYHELETTYYPLQWRDALEVIEKNNTDFSIAGAYGAGSDIQFSNSGLSVDSSAEDNLCVRAYRLIKKDFHELPAIRMHLHKAIPIGAGLGGGSADGTFALMLLNKKFELGLSAQQLSEYALQMGSDCPFFLLNKPCLASGRGERLEPIAVDLSNYKILLVHPGIHISTAWAFANISPCRPTKSVKEKIQLPVRKWRNELKNDFEEPVFKKYPEIKKIKDDLYRMGAMYSSLSGSGSSVYGIFEKERSIDYSPAGNLVRILPG